MVLLAGSSPSPAPISVTFAVSTRKFPTYRPGQATTFPPASSAVCSATPQAALFPSQVTVHVWQTPSSQMASAAHAPQFSVPPHSSEIVPHSMPSAAQVVGVQQLPPIQLSPLEHALLHAPQFCGSVV